MASSHSLHEQTAAGEFKRQEDAFREWISVDRAARLGVSAPPDHFLAFFVDTRE
jgi:glutathionyl-hydroquinone reductase